MDSLFFYSELKDLAEKVIAGQRLSREDGFRLMQSNELLTIGYMADLVRKRLHGDVAYFIANQQSSHTETVATMVYGHAETIEAKVDQLLKLREFQDHTKCYRTFTPFPFQAPNNGLEVMEIPKTTGYEDLKVLAVSRIILDNFDHIKCVCNLIGPKLAQVSLAFGVDDLDGTVVDDKIYNETGAKTNQSLTGQELVAMIKAAGRIPVERDIFYNVINKDF